MEMMTATPANDAGNDYLAHAGRPVGRFAAIALLHAVAAWALIALPGPDTVRADDAAIAVTVIASAPSEQVAEAAPQVKLQPPAIVPVALPLILEETPTPAPSVVRSAAAPAAGTAPSAPGGVLAAVPAAMTAEAAAQPEPRLVSRVEYVRRPRPVYPPMSKRLRETGVVTLRVLVDREGVPGQATVYESSGSSNLDEAGRQAVLNSAFKPYTDGGKPVAVFVLVPVSFSLS